MDKIVHIDGINFVLSHIVAYYVDRDTFSDSDITTLSIYTTSRNEPFVLRYSDYEDALDSQTYLSDRLNEL